MRIGTQFTGHLDAGQTRSWFTFGWPPDEHVIWHIMPVTPAIGAPEVEWEVEVERAHPNRVTYWLTVHNMSGVPINFEGRYAVLN